LERLMALLEDICETDEIHDNPDVDLFEAGLMDSLAMVALLVELEAEYGIDLKPSEVSREDVSSVNRLCVFLRDQGVDI